MNADKNKMTVKARAFWRVSLGGAENIIHVESLLWVWTIPEMSLNGTRPQYGVSWIEPAEFFQQRNSKAWVYVVATFIFIDVRHIMPGKIRFVCLDQRCVGRSDSYLILIHSCLHVTRWGTWTSTKVNSTEPDAATTKPTVTGRGRMQ